MVLMYAVNAMGVLRVSREGELYGLDLHEHGIAAYPEYVITALGSPAGSYSHVGTHESVPASSVAFSTTPALEKH
jgi:Amt family ammonium transporter